MIPFYERRFRVRILALTALLTLAAVAMAADRVVLFEEYTQTG